jgi:hypothetical protein
MIRQWRRRLHVLLVSLLVGLCAVDTAVACRLFGRRSCGCPAPSVAAACSGDKSLPADAAQPPTPEASSSDAPAHSAEPTAPEDMNPAVPPVPPAAPATEPAPADPSPAAPSAVPPPVPAEPVPPTPAPARAETPAAPAPSPASPSASESFDDLFPPATPAAPAASEPANRAAPVAPALPEPPARSPAPAPSPDEDDPFAPQAPAPAPAVDEDDPFAPAPAGNRTGQPAVPARPAPAADSFADPFQTSAALSAPLRQWTDDSGLFQIRGRLIAILDGKVRILKTTGRTTTVPLARLSAADRQYVARLDPPSEPAAPQVAAR